MMLTSLVGFAAGAGAVKVVRSIVVAGAASAGASVGESVGAFSVILTFTLACTGTFSFGFSFGASFGGSSSVGWGWDDIACNFTFTFAFTFGWDVGSLWEFTGEGLGDVSTSLGWVGDEDERDGFGLFWSIDGSVAAFGWGWLSGVRAFTFTFLGTFFGALFRAFFGTFVTLGTFFWWARFGWFSWFTFGWSGLDGCVGIRGLIGIREGSFGHLKVDGDASLTASLGDGIVGIGFSHAFDVNVGVVGAGDGKARGVAEARGDLPVGLLRACGKVSAHT